MLPISQIAERALSRDVFAFWSKDQGRRDAFASWVAAPDTIHLCPRWMVDHVRAAQPRSRVVALEDLPNQDTFLKLHALVGRDTRLILEGVSRYTNIDSPHFRRLHQLRKMTQYRYLIDTVPFTREIPKLYLPLSYLDREILQYPNGYAFQYNHAEEDATGRVRRAHDVDLLAEKVSPWSHVDDAAFLPPVEFVDVPMTPEEHVKYQVEKDRLFEKWDSPRKIVTDLCDAANLMPSRRDVFLSRLPLLGRTVVFTCIGRNSDLLRRHAKKAGCDNARFTTYMVHDGRRIEADTVVFYETPLNANQVSAVDVLADIAPGTQVLYFRCDAKADQFLFGEVYPGWEAIDAFTRALAAQQEAR